MLRILIVISLIFLPQIASGQVYMTKSGHVEFKSSVPLHSFKGRTNKLVGKINLGDSTVDFYVDVHTIKTGIDRRDNDMVETLEAEKYPFAEFYGKLTTNIDADTSITQDAKASGEFTVHGVSNKRTFEGTIRIEDGIMHLKASWTLNMKDYDIKPPGILFYRVSEMIPIQIDAALNQQQ